MAEIQLAPDQLAALVEVDAWADQAFILLGRTQRAALAAQRQVAAADQRLTDALDARNSVLQVLAGVLKLPDGDWEFNRERGTLVLKEPGHG